jgi:ferric-dicitrate binding protein FerR (iron transport regulator)
MRQRLHQRFGLSGDPAAVLERRLHRGRPRTDWERIIALRLHRAEGGLAMAVLLRGFADGPFGNEARTAVGRMQAKGLVTIQDNQVIPTPALRSMTDARSFSVGTRRGTARCGGGR